MKLLLKRLLSYFPSPLPVGMTHYKEWSASVVELIGPISSQEDLDFCVAAEVIRVGPQVCSIPKNYFVKRVRAGAAKQIAGAVFTEIKEAQKARFLQQQAEATAANKEANSANEKVGLQQTQS